MLVVHLPTQPAAMRQTTYPDEKTRDAFSALDDADFAPITVREDIAPDTVPTGPETDALDLFMTVVKGIFLYLPGAAALHFALMGMSLFFFYGGPTIEILIGTLGVSIVAMFMVMLGVGRLTDLRYLRVIGGILGAGSLASILYSISIVFFEGDFFGWFTLITLPLTIMIGQLIKIKTDRESS
jgi:hypothetical protein